MAPNIPVWQQYQTLIAALLGFGGVIITITVNGFLARRLEIFKYNRERDAIVAAVHAELELILEQIGTYLSVLSDMVPDSDIEIPLPKGFDTFGPTFDALTQKIGYLDKDIVLGITKTILRIRNLSGAFILEKIISDPDKDSRFYYISNIPNAVKEFSMLRDEIITTIRSLAQASGENRNRSRKKGFLATTAP